MFLGKVTSLCRDPLLLASCGTEKAELAMKSNRIDIKPLTTYTLSALTLHQPVPTEGQWGKTLTLALYPRPLPPTPGAFGTTGTI